MESALTGLGLIVVGLLAAFFGYRLFRWLLPLYGAILGFVLVWGWLGDSAWLIALIVGVIVAAVLGMFAYALWSVFFSISGFVMGLALASIVATSLNLGTLLSIVLAIVLSAGFGVLLWRFRSEIVIIATGVTGAAAAARGVGAFFGLRGGFDATRNLNSPVLFLLLAIVFAVVAVLGIWYQWGKYRKLDWYGFGAKQQEATPASPATRSTVASQTVSGTTPAGTAAEASAAPAAAVAVAAGAAVVAGREEEPKADAGPESAPAAATAAVAVGAQKAGDEPEQADVETEAGPEGTSAAKIPAGEPSGEPGGAVEDEIAAASEPTVGAAAVAAVAVAAEKAGGEPEQADVATEGAAEVATAAGVGVGEPAPEVEGPIAVASEPPTGAAAVAAVAVAAEEAGDASEKAEAVEAADDDSVQNKVDEAVKEISNTFPLDEIAKFKEKLDYVEGIGAVYAEKLRGAGIENVLDLLKRGATRKGRADLVEATGIAGKLILKWVNHADLYRIKGVGSEYADLLEAAGVDTVVELAHRNPANLLDAVLETNKTKRLVRKEPVASQVEDWVEQAKKLPRMIQY